MPDIRIGIVGAGNIAETHARAIAAVDGLSVSGVHCRNAERGAAFCKTHGGSYHASLSELLEHCDALSIATPSGNHLEAVEAAAAAGKHVLCEKPLEVSSERVERMRAACEKAGVLLGGIFQNRKSETAIQLREAVLAGRFGKLSQCSAYIPWYRDEAYYADSHWRGTWALDGGGALMNQGIHTLDLLQWVAGPIVEVSAQAQARVHPDIEVEDNLAAWLRFEHGGIGLLQASTACWPGRDYRVELLGENGSAILEGGRISTWDFREAQAEDEAIRAAGQSNALGSGASDPKGISDEGHRRQFEDFREAINGTDGKIISAEEAAKPIRVIEAIYISAREGRNVAIR